MNPVLGPCLLSPVTRRLQARGGGGWLAARHGSLFLELHAGFDCSRLSNLSAHALSAWVCLHVFRAACVSIFVMSLREPRPPSPSPPLSTAAILLLIRYEFLFLHPATDLGCDSISLICIVLWWNICIMSARVCVLGGWMGEFNLLCCCRMHASRFKWKQI